MNELPPQVREIADRELPALLPLAKWWAARVVRSLPHLDACDVYGDLLMRVAQSLYSYDPTRPLAPWVKTVLQHEARNLVVWYKRHCRRGRRYEEAFTPYLEDTLTRTASPLDCMALRRLSCVKLRARESRILYTRFVLGESPQTQKADLGMPRETLRQFEIRVITKLRARLAK